METGQHNTDEIIARVLLGEATAAEKAWLETWRKIRPENESAYLQSEKTFNSFDNRNFSPDVNAAWNKLKGKIVESQPRIIPIIPRRRYLQVAAAIAVLAMLTLLTIYFLPQKNTETFRLAATTVSEEKHLPDGSLVKLNSHSELTYTEIKNGGREVHLKGEAFFEVRHRDDQSFVVKVNDVMIRDIGTAFNISEKGDKSEVEVRVDEGEVQFYTEESSGIKLVKGETGIYDRHSGVFRKTVAVTSGAFTGSQNRRLQFSDSRLEDVLMQINAAYGASIVTEDPEAANCRLSVSFNNEPLEVIVAVIAETLELEPIQKGDTLFLTGNACH